VTVEIDDTDWECLDCGIQLRRKEGDMPLVCPNCKSKWSMTLVCYARENERINKLDEFKEEQRL
jgi:hypothetical protein